MEELPSVVVNGAKKRINYRLISLGLLILLTGMLLGVVLSRYVFKTQINVPSITQPLPLKIDESKLPISLPLLLNPIVYEWRGSVQGRLTEKKENYFTLTDPNGNSITINDKVPSGEVFKAVFYEKTESKWKEVSLKDVPLGSNLLGDFFIFKGAKNTPVGSSFKVDR